MLEAEVATIIKELGWNIARGPYYNGKYAHKGIHLWSIKSVLSKKDMEDRGIKLGNNSKPGDTRTVRFMAVVEDGEMMPLRHVTSSERKKLGPRRGSKNRVKSSTHNTGD